MQQLDIRCAVICHPPRNNLLSGDGTCDELQGAGYNIKGLNSCKSLKFYEANGAKNL